MLTGIIIEQQEHKKIFKLMAKLKKNFNNEKMILHSLELTRTNKAKQKKFRILANKDIRVNFYSELNELLKGCNFSITLLSLISHGMQNNFRLLHPTRTF